MVGKAALRTKPGRAASQICETRAWSTSARALAEKSENAPAMERIDDSFRLQRLPNASTSSHRKASCLPARRSAPKAPAKN